MSRKMHLPSIVKTVKQRKDPSIMTSYVPRKWTSPLMILVAKAPVGVARQTLEAAPRILPILTSSAGREDATNSIGKPLLNFSSPRAVETSPYQSGLVQLSILLRRFLLPIVASERKHRRVVSWRSRARKRAKTRSLL